MIGVMDMAAVGRLLDVRSRTVAQWRRRYRDTHPTPAPDGYAGRSPYWGSDRADEWRKWAASRPGQGAGGGRPAKTA